MECLIRRPSPFVIKFFLAFPTIEIPNTEKMVLGVPRENLLYAVLMLPFKDRGPRGPGVCGCLGPDADSKRFTFHQCVESEKGPEGRGPLKGGRGRFLRALPTVKDLSSAQFPLGEQSPLRRKLPRKYQRKEISNVLHIFAIAARLSPGAVFFVTGMVRRRGRSSS